jgi:nucleotide-binding universal stress UspA family protein
MTDENEEGIMRQRIVVGVDGSETAELAVRWAAAEADRRGASLELVAAWEVPTSNYGFGLAPITEDVVKGLMKAAEENIGNALDVVRAEAESIEVITTVMEGQAARVLLDVSRDADLLVVGSRGLGGFRELLLGSVSQQCAHHATCPVVIVRHVHEAAA